MDNITSSSVNGVTTRTMTMHQLLAEIKLTKAKLDNMTTKLFVSYKKHGDTAIDNVPVEKAEEIMKGNLDSIRHLISNLTAYETVRYKSNANTSVEINGKTMTVADAIKRKENIKYEEALLNELERQYKGASRNISTENAKLEANAKSKVEAIKTDSMSADSLMEIMKADIENNTYEMVDPNNIVELIRTMKEDINGFKTEVDAALSTSNALTVVEVKTYD